MEKAMTTQKIKRLIHLATKTDINGYSDEAAKEKEEFLSLCRSYAKMIVKELGLTPEQYEIRTNRAGVAVSGDVHLHTDSLYVAFEQTCLGNDWGYMYRSCKGKKDYTGGYNRWMKWENLINVQGVVTVFKDVAAPKFQIG
jgi:hypothetical protein